MLTTVDGNTITANISYKLSDSAFIYPITPSTGGSEQLELLTRKNKKNIFERVPVVRQMQSELGSIAACHGAAYGGGVPTTFTSSQGLLLMIPSLIKMVGERKSCVVNVAARSLATHTLSVFGDHSDIRQIINTGCVILASANASEC